MYTVTIQDPVHGSIEVSAAEIKLIDSRPFQRLRYIKQLGFSEFAFPGATHSRYSHSLGAMQMATGMIDRVLSALSLSVEDESRLRQTVRLAVLFHDLGHGPMSHVCERVMPPVQSLNLGAWTQGQNRQASHEDYTIKLLVDSELTGLIEKHMGDVGVTGARLAALVCGRTPPGDEDAFVIAGQNYLPLLSQIVSSELDADRMDYLRRDAYYCGVSYGNFDHNWLTSNITAVQYEGQWGMALDHKGVWAFENFLLARYHMFLSVYYHHTAICFDELLGRFFKAGEYTLPSDTEGYLQTDDVHLLAALRASKDQWAGLIVNRKPFRLLVETHDGDAANEKLIDARLDDAGIDTFRVRKKAILSKYFGKRDTTFPLLVNEKVRGKVTRIEEYTPLYERFSDPIAVSRVFCEPSRIKEARALL